MEQWYNSKNVRIKEDKVVIKLRNPADNSLMDSIAIPTELYPLSGLSSIVKVFHNENTEILNDTEILSIFDMASYNIGKCYSNSNNLYELLKKKKVNVKAYAGWLFVGESEYPIHHSWLVIDDIYLIDLSDDFYMFEDYLRKKGVSKEYLSAENLIEVRKYLKELKNSERCYPIGKAHSMLFYVGCECSPEEAKREYRKLVKKFPNHKVQRNCDSTGINRTQALLKDNGLL